MKTKHIFSRFIHFALVSGVLSSLIFAGCSMEDKNESASHKLSGGDGKSAEKVILKVGLDNPVVSRDALPNISLSDLNYISLEFQDVDEDGDFLPGLTSIGSWGSVKEMDSSDISFKTGTYKFTLTAMTTDIIFAETKEYTIASGMNQLKFAPKLAEFDNSEPYGKGNLEVSIRYVDEGISLVTAGLYTLDGGKAPGYADQVLEIMEGGNSVYRKQKVPSGNYILLFKFYADTEKKLLRGTYREYCSIVNNMTSFSECVLSNMGSLFTITYVLNGGSFANGFTTSGNYTRQSETVELPLNTDTETVISKAKATFGGWYENLDFSGEPVTQIPAGSTGNKTFYARWFENATITFDTNATKASIGTKTQTVIKGVPAIILSAEELGLQNPEGSFLGWSTKSTDLHSQYDDGSSITVDGNTTLYAIWSVATINPKSAGDTTDSDGDGLTDWDELHKYFTDPTSKDTDGDGWDDGTETQLYNSNTNSFNPIIADTPQLEVKMTGKPGIYYKYTISETDSQTVSVTENDGYTGSSSSSKTNTKTHNETHGWSSKVGLSVAHEWGSGSGYKNVTTISGEVGYNGSVANGDTYTYSQSASEGWSKSWSNGQSTTKSNGKTISGGKLSIPVRFINPSNIAYTVNNVTVALYRLPSNAGESRSFVKNLELDSDNIFTIPAGSESGDFKLSAELSIPQTENLLKFSSGFEIEVSGYRITMTKDKALSNDFTEALTEVKAKTAAIYIDWGNTSGRAARTFNVSVKNQYNVEALSLDDIYTQPTLDYIFQTMLHFTKGDGNMGYSLNENGCLDSFLTVKNEAKYEDGSWFILHKYTNNGTRYQSMYAPYTESLSEGEGWSFEDIKVNAGDEIYIFFSEDKDGDGVPLNEEVIYGTSDKDSDFDKDGLTDYEEIYGWYKSGIGLESKYSDNFKVYSNPLLTDTDGDDLLDYSADSSLRDSDPIIPKLKDDTSLKVTQYMTKSRGTPLDFTYNSLGDYYTIFGWCKETVCFDIQPKAAFATVQISRSQGGPYVDFDKDTEFDLDAGTGDLSTGKNIFYVLCTAPDGNTTKEYKFKVDSRFNEMTGFDYVNNQYEGGKTTFSWNAYSDKRATSDRSGGYILYGKKNSLSSKTLLWKDIPQAVSATSKSGISSKDEFYIALTPDILKPQHSYELELAANTDYKIYLFAYSLADTSDTFISTKLAETDITTKLAETGKLTFWAHYVKDVSDEDDNCDPQYYWSWSSTESMFSSMASDINLGAKGPDFDVDDEQYYCFGEKRIHYGAPEKYSSCSKSYTGDFSLKKEHTFSLSFDAWEYDRGSGDDHLGKVTMYFKYFPSTNCWKIYWDNPGGTSNENYYINYGDSPKNCAWKINSSDGDIEVHFGVKWDEK